MKRKYFPARVQQYARVLRDAYDMPGDLADAVAFATDSMVTAAMIEGPTMPEGMKLGNLIARDPAMRYFYECGCFRRSRLEDMPIWIGGDRATVAAGAASGRLSVAPAEPAMLIRFLLSTLFDIAGKQQDAAPACGITVLERAGPRTFLKRANEIVGSQLPAIVAAPWNRTQGLPTGPVPVSSTEPLFYNFTNNAAEAVEHNAGGLGFLMDWDAWRAARTRIDYQAHWIYWLSAAIATLAPGATGTFRLYGAEDGSIRKFFASAASTLTSAGGLFTLGAKHGLNILSIEQARVDLISSATAGEGVPGSEASYESGGQIVVKEGAEDLHIAAAAPNAVDIDIENQNPGTVIVTLGAPFRPDTYKKVC